MSNTRDEYLPVSVLLPTFPDGQTEIYDNVSALKYLYFTRANAPQSCNEEWDKCGVYILFGNTMQDGHWEAYVGQAVSLSSRLVDHKRRKEFWTTGLFIQRDTTYGFSSADIGWLEAELYELLDASAFAVLQNKEIPRDDTLTRYNIMSLENLMDPIAAVMRLIGFDPASVDDENVSPIGKQVQRHSVSLKDLFQADLIHLGDRLIGTNLTWQANAEITNDGEILFDGKSYAAPSAAAKVAVKKLGRAREEINGWDYWAMTDVDGRTKLSVIRKRYENMNQNK